MHFLKIIVKNHTIIVVNDSIWHIPTTQAINQLKVERIESGSPTHVYTSAVVCDDGLEIDISSL